MPVGLLSASEGLSGRLGSVLCRSAHYFVTPTSSESTTGAVFQRTEDNRGKEKGEGDVEMVTA